MKMRAGACLVALVLAAAPSVACAQGSRAEAPAAPALRAAGTGTGGPGALLPSLDRMALGLAAIERTARAGRVEEARQAALRLYLDEYELLEATYGAGSGRSSPALAARIAGAEGRFHELLRATDAGSAVSLAAGLRADVASLSRLAGSLPASPGADPSAGSRISLSAPTWVAGASVKAPELRSVLSQLDSAEAAYRGGRGAEAMSRVERLYLDGIEPLEARLPQARVHAIERAVHLGVRAALAQGAPARVVSLRFAGLRGELVRADGLLGPGAPAWLGAGNAFFVLVREGLEAVLLIAALLAYLAAAGAGRRARRQIWAGAGAGVLATLATWAVATAVVPLGGASRELVEGVTGLLAVVVLLYVSNWLFQKTYIHDWKDYLRQHVGKAVTTGSAVAMASLAFAAVYREGFETVLFYQALLFDAGPRAVLAGAIPGALLIGAMGWGIIRLGVKLPLKRVFALTNAVLLYLAFTFVGKGLYNLQEAGLFAPHPLGAVPDAVVLRQLFGVYPVVECLAAQLVFALGVGATYLFYRRRLARGRAGGSAAASGTLVQGAAVAGR